MQSIQIKLEDWQSAALASLARAQGIAIETMAQKLVSEQIDRRSDQLFNSLFFDAAGRQTTIEQRLEKLFAE